MNFKSEKFQNIFIAFLVIAIILVLSVDVIQAKSNTENKFVSIKKKSPILDKDIKANIPDKDIKAEDIPQVENIDETKNMKT